CIEYADRLSYVYGCSSNDHRNCMPNYLMQWTMIRDACAKGLSVYDFQGVPYWYDVRHRNYGVYRFKSGFSGRVRTYAGEFDLYLRPVLSSIFDVAWRLKKRLAHRGAARISGRPAALPAETGTVPGSAAAGRMTA
ncbi:MAG: peptidoglycan bridge formation glycyltransferase FemA/FemB family protein, partial [Lachnospiraceae bacterium]|nr:peptidoglycan bridge formation glycyltransferase FemA/FemB family protein [Lachnospiraceae bacterium]